MFAGISARYDRANRFLTLGLDQWWRRQLARQVAASRPQRVADLATGSGDVAISLRRKLDNSVKVEGMDFCAEMLQRAREKAAKLPAEQAIEFQLGDCLSLPLPDSSVDALTIAFGFRNLEDRRAGCAEFLRVLRPGGSLYILEFSQPWALIRPFYYFHLRYILPHLAAWITGEKSAYQYLGGTISRFPTRAELADFLRDQGFVSVTARAMTAGIVAIHEARKS